MTLALSNIVEMASQQVGMLEGLTRRRYQQRCLQDEQRRALVQLSTSSRRELHPVPWLVLKQWR